MVCVGTCSSCDDGLHPLVAVCLLLCRASLDGVQGSVWFVQAANNLSCTTLLSRQLLRICRRSLQTPRSPAPLMLKGTQLLQAGRTAAQSPSLVPTLATTRGGMFARAPEKSTPSTGMASIAGLLDATMRLAVRILPRPVVRGQGGLSQNACKDLDSQHTAPLPSLQRSM